MYFLIPLCLCLAGVFLWQESKKNYVPAVALKGAASLCFVILGFILLRGSRVGRLICIGLLLGCIADILLNLRFVVGEKGQLVFLVGIAVFLAGHILYLAAVLSGAKYWWICVLVGAVLTALLMAWIFKRITAKKAFKIFGVVYIGAIVILNCVAVGNLIASPSAFTAVFALGCVLFLVSDVVLILNTFGTETKQSLRNVNIGLYYIGQILIAVSLLFLK